MSNDTNTPGPPEPPAPAAPLAPPTAATAPAVPPPEVLKPPRLLGAIAVTLLGLAVALGFQAIGGAFIGAVGGIKAALTPGNNGQAGIEDLLRAPLFATLMILLTECGLLLTALAVAGRCRLSRREQFGLARPSITVRAYVAFVLGTLLIAALGTILATPVAMLLDTDDSIDVLRQGIGPLEAVLFVLVIAIAPGIAEELFVRGYIQRRLLRRMRPGWAIAWSSVLFALLHLEPVHVVFTLPIGVWLGIIAWRTGSIWPGIVCHAALNGLWNVWGILVMKEIIPALVAGFASLGIILLAVLGFALSVPILARLKPPMPAGPSAFLPQARPVWPPAAVPIAVPVLAVATNSAPPAIQHDKPADPGVSS